MILSAESIQTELRKHSSPERKVALERFFKTGKGQYGEGDVFIGVSNPDIRKVCKKSALISLPELEQLITSKVHEDRFAAVVLLVQKFKKGTQEEQREILEVYLKHIDWINNWDLVDVSAHHIIGRSVAQGYLGQQFLDELALSPRLWYRRISIIATMYFIDQWDLAPTLRISHILLSDTEDLIHKAVGWMLREAWKQDSERVEQFLETYYQDFPRTALRYAIERMPEPKRKAYLKGEFV